MVVVGCLLIKSTSRSFVPDRQLARIKPILAISTIHALQTRGSSLANFSKPTATWNFAFLVNSTVGIMRKGGCISLKGSVRCATLRFISIPFSFFCPFLHYFFFSSSSSFSLEYSCCTLPFKGLTMIDNLRGLCFDNLIRQIN